MDLALGTPRWTPQVVFRRGGPRLQSDAMAEEAGVRRYRDLAAVAAVPPGRSHRRVQYWWFSGVAVEGDRDAMNGSQISYDLTVIASRAMGWERAKTYGHVHRATERSDVGFPEVYQVLQGRGGFLIQDLWEGPRATFATLIGACEGDVVVIPPLVYHVTINLGETPLVVANAVCRAAVDDYAGMRAAHGMAHRIGVDDEAVLNPAYRECPALLRVTAGEWSRSAPGGSLYAAVASESSPLAWLCDPTATAPAASDARREVTTPPAARASQGSGCAG